MVLYYFKLVNFKLIFANLKLYSFVEYLYYLLAFT